MRHSALTKDPYYESHSRTTLLHEYEPPLSQETIPRSPTKNNVYFSAF